MQSIVVDMWGGVLKMIVGFLEAYNQQGDLHDLNLKHMW